MKNICLLLFLVAILWSCNNKTNMTNENQDTLHLSPPAALDTLQVQPRPADSMLNTRKN